MLPCHRCGKAITPDPRSRILPLTEPLVARWRHDGLGAYFRRENTFVRGNHQTHHTAVISGNTNRVNKHPFKEVVHKGHGWNDAAEIWRDPRSGKEAEIEAHEMSHPAQKAHVKSFKVFGDVREWNPSWNCTVDRHSVTSIWPPNPSLTFSADDHPTEM